MYTLIDGKAKNAAHPETFHIPDAREIAAIKEGSLVKIGFEEETGAERMWVNVTKVGDTEFEGRLDNVPFGLKTVKLGDTVTFKAKHILDIWE